MSKLGARLARDLSVCLAVRATPMSDTYSSYKYIITYHNLIPSCVFWYKMIQIYFHILSILPSLPMWMLRAGWTYRPNTVGYIACSMHIAKPLCEPSPSQRTFGSQNLPDFSSRTPWIVYDRVLYTSYISLYHVKIAVQGGNLKLQPKCLRSRPQMQLFSREA